MTNGEKIKELFPRKCPHIGFNENFGRVWLMQNGEDFANFTLKWWNEEYKEPTTKNDLEVDAISRAEVLKLMQDNWHTHNGDWAMQESMDDIRALPSITPIRPKGQWITKPHVYGVTYCSECNFELKIDNTNYCPNCGSRNEVEE